MPRAARASRLGVCAASRGSEAPQFPDGPVSQTVHDHEHGFIHKLLLGEIFNAVPHEPLAHSQSMKSWHCLVAQPFQAVHD